MIRLIVISSFALFLTTPASAGVYKCTDASGAMTFQQTPCKGEVTKQPSEETSEAAASASGYNAACTHFNGRRVMPMKELGTLSEARQEEYLEWLFSEDAPTKEEKDACLAARDAGLPVEAEDETEAGKMTEDDMAVADAVKVYSMVEGLKYQVAACNKLSPGKNTASQEALDELSEQTADLQAKGKEYAGIGISIAGQSVSPAEIENDIRKIKKDIDDQMAHASAGGDAAIAAECDNLPEMISFMASMMQF